jgi:hypothetical protein
MVRLGKVLSEPLLLRALSKVIVAMVPSPDDLLVGLIYYHSSFSLLNLIHSLFCALSACTRTAASTPWSVWARCPC